MSPTVDSNDYLLLSKNKRIDDNSLIVFRNYKNNVNYVKRVIAIPGDIIILCDDRIEVYSNDKLKRALSAEFNDGYCSCYSEIHIPYSNDFYNYNHLLNACMYEEIVIENERFLEDAFFVLGDNLNNSRDSRHFGLVGRSRVKGVVSLSMRVRKF